MSVTRVSPDLAEFLHHPDEIRRIRKGTATVMLVLFATNVFAGPPGWNESTGTLTINMPISGTETYVRLGYGASAPGGDYYLTIYKNSSGTENSAWQGQSACETSEIKKIIVNGSGSGEIIDLSIIDDSTSAWDYAALSGDIEINGGGGIDTIDGSGLADVIDGGADADVIDAGDGEDEIWGRGGSDWVDGGADRDHIMDCEAGDTLFNCGRLFTIDAGLSSENFHQRKSLKWLIDNRDLEPEDTIEIDKATYKEVLDLDLTNDSGSAAHPIVFKGVNGTPVFDGEDSSSSDWVMKIGLNEHLEFRNIAWKQGYKWNVWISHGKHISFYDCSFNSVFGGMKGAAGVRISGGDAHSITGYTSGSKDIHFEDCEANENWVNRGIWTPSKPLVAGGHGWDMNPETAGFMEDIKLIDCEALRNGYQGVRTQEIKGFTIDGGTFSNNGGSGIQIESGTEDFEIKYATCNHNSEHNANECGIWVAGSLDGWLYDCSVSENPHGYTISQSEYIDVEDCSVSSPQQNINYWHNFTSGFRLGPGHEDNRFPVGSSHSVTNMPFGGVRHIDIINPDFSGVDGVKTASVGNEYVVVYGGSTPESEVFNSSNERTITAHENYFRATQPSDFNELKWKINGVQSYDSLTEALNFN